MIVSLSTHLTKTAALAGAVGAITFGVAAAGAQARTVRSHTTVPPIHELFTHQACPADPSTTIDLDNCAADKVLSLDQKIDRLDAAIIAKLPAAGQKQFVTAARAWLSYRNDVARAAGSPSSGGTIEPLEELTSMQTEDGAHITALTKEFTSANGQKP